MLLAPVYSAEALALHGARSDALASHSAQARSTEGFYNLHKTALCFDFRRDGKCGKGAACNFAHGEGELRSDPRKAAQPKAAQPKAAQPKAAQPKAAQPVQAQQAEGAGRAKRPAGHAHNDYYKTSPCFTFDRTGACDKGALCPFAHGAEDLRPRPSAPARVPSKDTLGLSRDACASSVAASAASAASAAVFAASAAASAAATEQTSFPSTATASVTPAEPPKPKPSPSPPSQAPPPQPTESLQEPATAPHRPGTPDSHSSSISTAGIPNIAAERPENPRKMAPGLEALHLWLVTAVALHELDAAEVADTLYGEGCRAVEDVKMLVADDELPEVIPRVMRKKIARALG